MVVVASGAVVPTADSEVVVAGVVVVDDTLTEVVVVVVAVLAAIGCSSGAHAPIARAVHKTTAGRRPITRRRLKTQISFRSAAQRVSSFRLDSCSLRNTDDTWDSIVLIEM